MSNYLVISILSMLFIILFMPFNFWISRKLNLVDKPNKRKMHTDIKYSGGGISLYVGATLFSIILYYFGYKESLVIIIPSTILFITGLLDDKFSISAKLKLLLQVITASTVFLMGTSITRVSIIEVEFNLFFSFIVTVLWIVALINAINLIDGLDGLASGVAIIILFTLAISSNDSFTFLLTASLIGMLFGFLKFNFFPSKIFLGDTGSMFLGLMIAILSIIGTTKTAVSLATIILSLSFPLIDMLFAVIRRLLNHKPIFSPDKNHIHHRLIKKGFSHKNSVLLIYLINILFGIISCISLVVINHITFLLFLVIIYSLVNYTLIKYLNVFEKH